MTKFFYVAGGVVLLCAVAGFVVLSKITYKVTNSDNSQQVYSSQKIGSTLSDNSDKQPADTQSTTTPQPSGEFTEFLYQDTTPNLSATVYLPQSAGQWGVQNPYKGANQSLIKSPQVFVKAAFQDINDPTIYGLIRVVYDLQGIDCYTFFTGLAQLEGLQLQTYSSTTSNQIKDGKAYVFEYYQNQKNMLVGSRVVCDNKYGLELMVVAPDTQAYYGNVVQTILQYAQLTIPGTPTGSK